MCGFKKEEDGRNYTVGSLIVHVLHLILLGQLNQGGCGG
jgi:hypothetical protein